MKIEELEKVLELLKKNEVNEFEFEQEGTKIKLVRGGQFTVSQSVYPQGFAPAFHESTNFTVGQRLPEGEKDEEINPSFIRVESPIVGTFYRKPRPESEPFVSAGDIIKKGDTICIVEAMKVMNEIEAPCNGKVEKVFLNDGHVVEYGELLFLISPTE